MSLISLVVGVIPQDYPWEVQIESKIHSINEWIGFAIANNGRAAICLEKHDWENRWRNFCEINFETGEYQNIAARYDRFLTESRMKFYANQVYSLFKPVYDDRKSKLQNNNE